MTDNATTRPAALKLLAKGLVTQSEAARLAGISRQLVRKWVKGADTVAAREAYLDRIWRKAMAKRRSGERP